MTPAMVHYGMAEEQNEKRQVVLDLAYAVNPERFVAGRPKTKDIPKEAWINNPDSQIVLESLGTDIDTAIVSPTEVAVS